MSNIAYKAMCFAMEAHKEQERKYTNEPYWQHLAEVAGLISTIYNDQEIIAIAWLHDTLEDTQITYDDLIQNFNLRIADGVLALSDLEKGNRKERKRLSRERLNIQEKWIQDIKICDVISNTTSIVLKDPEFARLFLIEVTMLLDVLTRADRELLKLAELVILKSCNKGRK